MTCVRFKWHIKIIFFCVVPCYILFSNEVVLYNTVDWLYNPIPFSMNILISKFLVDCVFDKETSTFTVKQSITNLQGHYWNSQHRLCSYINEKIIIPQLHFQTQIEGNFFNISNLILNETDMHQFLLIECEPQVKISRKLYTYFLQAFV